MRGINLAGIATDLTYVNDSMNRLMVEGDGQVNPQQLKTMLELSPGSAQILERLWILTASKTAV
jgi:hypothetical protein